MSESMTAGVRVRAGEGVGEPVSAALRAAMWRLSEAREQGVFRAGAPLGRRMVQEHTTLLMALVDRVHDLEEGLRPLSRREAGWPSVTDPREAGAIAASRGLSGWMVCEVVGLAEQWAGEVFRAGGDAADDAIGAQMLLLASWAEDAEFLEGAVRLPAVARMEARVLRRWARVSRFAARVAARFGGRAAA